MPVTFSSYRLGPGQRVSNKTVPPPWDWLLRRENELGPRRSKSRITFAVLVPPFYVAVQAPALIVTEGVIFQFFEIMALLVRSHHNNMFPLSASGTSQVGAISKAQKNSKNNYLKHLEKYFFSKKYFWKKLIFSKKCFLKKVAQC